MARHPRLRRQTSLSAIPSLSPAMTLDPFTNELLLCNAASGDILRCDPVTLMCEVEVEQAALLAASSPRASVGQ